MGLRSLPFFKAKKGWQFAGGGLSDDGGGGGGSLPIATAETLGGVRIGSGINVDNDGTISVSGGNVVTLTGNATGSSWKYIDDISSNNISSIDGVVEWTYSGVHYVMPIGISYSGNYIIVRLENNRLGLLFNVQNIEGPGYGYNYTINIHYKEV